MSAIPLQAELSIAGTVPEQKDVQDLYNRMDQIWDERDRWFGHTYRSTAAALKLFLAHLDVPAGTTLLNAGSGGNDYGVTQFRHIHVDIADQKIAHIPGSIVASVEELPFPDEHVALSLCVGSVLVYVDAAKAVRELSRTLRAGGYLIIDFENSLTFEYMGQPAYGAPSPIIETFLYDQKATQRVFSEDYMRDLLAQNDIEVLERTSFHLLTPLIYRLTGNTQMAAHFAWLDPLLANIPFFTERACNVVYLCRKRPR